MDRLLRLRLPLGVWLLIASPWACAGAESLPPPEEHPADDRLVAGIVHVCALGDDGTAVCRWPRSGIAPAVGVDDAVQIAAGGGDGGEHVCVRRATGRVACWQFDPEAGPVEVPGVDDAIDVAGGTYQAALVRASGEVLLFSPGSERMTTLPGADAVEVATSIGQTCVRRRDRSVACGGRSIGSVFDAEEIHVGTAIGCLRRETGAVVCWDSGGTPETLTGVDDAVEIAIAGDQPCARRAAGQVVCWPGIGTEPRVAAAVDDAVELADVAGYANNHCARRASGEIVCWSWGGTDVETLVGL